MSRILVLGGLGMLGHRLAATLAEQHEAGITLRDPADALPRGYPDVEVIGDTDLRDAGCLTSILATGRWQVVVNAAGVIKQRNDSRLTAEMVAVNALLPHTLAELCATADIRFIHFSSDCVFSGSPDSLRGANGYRPDDPPDARDAYGLSKLLGEPDQRGCLTVRTSLIGRELRGHHGLLDWYLGEKRASVPGFTRALFTGLTTPVAARLVDFLVREHPDLDGLWHVAAAPISKYELLGLVRGHLSMGPDITPDPGFFCDRRLDGSAFRSRTGWRAPAWPAMIEELAHLDSPCAS